MMLVGLACDDRIIDDYGPPAGFARVQGTVADTSGSPVGGATVNVNRCGEGVATFLAVTTTSEGAYRAEGSLPPRGAFIIADSLFPYGVECSVSVDRSASVESITVPFYRKKTDVIPVELDLVAN